MGSLDAPGIPVPGKTPESYRRMDTRITKTDAADDVVQEVVALRPELSRPLGSGCIVKDMPGGAIAECHETVVWGLYQAGSSTSERIASDENAARDLKVAITGSGTLAVIPTSLEPDTPQTSVRSLGTHIDRRNSVTDDQIDSVESPGLNDQLPH
jgi:hypothetical protein